MSPQPASVQRVLVVGGTGLLGQTVVSRLRAEGVPVRVLSRGLRSPARGSVNGVEHVLGDIVTGDGLAAALDGVEVVVHAAPSLGRLADAVMSADRSEDTSEERARPGAQGRGATEGMRAGRPHLVYVSIVGVDTIPFGFYRTKLAEEERVAASGLRWSVLRATQFHDLVAVMLRAVTTLPVIALPAGFRVQPVGAADVGDRLAQLALAEPTCRIEELGGPEVRTLRDLAETALKQWGRSRRIVEVAVPGRLAEAMRAGRNLTPEHGEGTVTFEEYLHRLAATGERPYAGVMRSYLSWPAIRRILPGRSRP